MFTGAIRAKKLQIGIFLKSATQQAIHQILSPSHFTHKRMMATAMAKRLEGKTIVITGASSGIGWSTAMEFARTAPNNLKLVLAARRIDALEQIAKDIEKEAGSGVQVLPFKIDISNSQEVEGFVKALPAEFRDIDILVNNA
jgi:3-hydroxy acid dehydrogenase / malonic semialdehyde reductase